MTPKRFIEFLLDREKLKYEIESIVGCDYTDKIAELVAAYHNDYTYEYEIVRLESVLNLLCNGVDPDEVCRLIENQNEVFVSTFISETQNLIGMQW